MNPKDFLLVFVLVSMLAPASAYPQTNKPSQRVYTELRGHSESSSSSPLLKDWTSIRGEFSRRGLLVSINENSCSIEFTNKQGKPGELVEIKISKLCKLDQAIVESLRGIDLDDLDIVQEILEPLLNNELKDDDDIYAVGEIAWFKSIRHQDISIKTKLGTYATRQITSISPCRLELEVNGKPKFIYLNRLSKESQKLFRYDLENANEYRRALNDLKKSSHNLSKSHTRSSFHPTARDSWGHVWVRAHTRSDGTFVPGHFRTRQNNSFLDNWSTVGNVNPYTGKRGTKKPQQSVAQKKAARVALAQRLNSTKAEKEKEKRKQNSSSFSRSYSSSRTIHTGPRGGRYYYNSNGNKTYIKR